MNKINVNLGTINYLLQIGGATKAAMMDQPAEGAEAGLKLMDSVVSGSEEPQAKELKKQIEQLKSLPVFADKETTKKAVRQFAKQINENVKESLKSIVNNGVWQVSVNTVYKYLNNVSEKSSDLGWSLTDSSVGKNINQLKSIALIHNDKGFVDTLTTLKNDTAPKHNKRVRHFGDGLEEIADLLGEHIEDMAEKSVAQGAKEAKKRHKGSSDSSDDLLNLANPASPLSLISPANPMNLFR